MIYHVYQDSFTFSSAVFVSAHISDKKIENNSSKVEYDQAGMCQNVNKI